MKMFLPKEDLTVLAELTQKAESLKDKLDKEYDEVRKSELLTEIENVSKSFKPVMTNVTRFE